MKILFLDQSGALGGAELCLLDILSELPAACMVGLLQDGPFRERLEAHQIPVQVLSQAGIKTRKESSLLQGMAGFVQLLPIIRRTTRLAQDCDLIYANTPKALILGACASVLTGLPLVSPARHYFCRPLQCYQSQAADFAGQSMLSSGDRQLRGNQSRLYRRRGK